jgi:predicted house-cleaning noncanonical NTP pyrophosphatase (MazG superfamily)
MTQQQINNLLGVSSRTLRHWKNSNRQNLYHLLENLDFESAQNLLQNNLQEDLRMILENEKYFTNQRDFERKLYPLLTSKFDVSTLLKFSKERTLSFAARSRAGYLYSFLTNKVAKLTFKTKPNIGFFYQDKTQTENGLAKMYGLTSGIDMARFNQYKMTGSF